MKKKFLLVLLLLFVLVPFPLFSDGVKSNNTLTLMNKLSYTYAVHVNYTPSIIPQSHLQKSVKKSTGRLQKKANGKRIKGLLLILSAAASGKKY